MTDIIPQDNTPLKRCPGPCGRMLPRTTEFFHRQGNHLHPRCKECRNAQKKIEHAENREKDNARSRAYQRANNERIRQQHKDYYESHKEQAKAYHHAHREHRIEYDKAWHQAHKEHAKQYRDAYYQAHIEEFREYSKAYAKANPIKNRLAAHRRRIRKHGNGGSYTVKQIEAQLKRQKHKCYYTACGHAKFKKANGKYVYHIDHVVPISRGGSNDISNIVLACPSCNDRKHAKLPHEWPEGGRLL